MSLSCEDLKSILEIIEHLVNEYNSKLEKIEHLEEHADEASYLNDDCLFLESVKLEIEQSITNNKSIDYSILSNEKYPENLDFLSKYTSQLSIDEKLLLSEVITEFLIKETNLMQEYNFLL